MSRIKLRPSVGDAVNEPEKLSSADRYAKIMGDISFDYDLEPDVLDVAQDVLQALKAIEKQWPRESKMSGIIYM